MSTALPPSFSITIWVDLQRGSYSATIHPFMTRRTFKNQSDFCSFFWNEMGTTE
jgi:hypothetical protein